MKSVDFGDTDVKHVNSENIPINKVKYYFGFWDIQYLLLCLMENYRIYKQVFKKKKKKKKKKKNEV